MNPTHLKNPLTRFIAGCVTPVYHVAIALRNAAFNTGLRKQHRAHVPVISIGNITTGGTGKTPMVQFVARLLLDNGYKPAVLLRGYKRDAARLSDEETLHREALPSVPILANPDRVASARRLQREHPEVNVILLDDGFQHRRLARDLDIVLIDATNPFGYGRLLPRGLLREPPSSLRRADAVVVTRADTVDATALALLDREVERQHAKPPAAHTAHKWSQVLDDQDMPVVFPTQSTTVIVHGSELGEYQTFNELRHKSYRYAKDHFLGKVFVAHSDGHAIVVPAKGIAKSTSGKRKPEELKVIVALPQMIEHSVSKVAVPDALGRPEIKAVHRRAVEVMIGGVRRNFTLIVHETKDGRRFYDSHIEQKKTPQPESEMASPAKPEKLHTSEATESYLILGLRNHGSSSAYLPGVFLLAAIGNPMAFIEQASRRFTVVGQMILPDHSLFTPALLGRLAGQLKQVNAGAVLTTEKDWVKLRTLLQSHPLGVPVWRVQLWLDFLDGEEAFTRLLLNAAKHG